MNTRKEGTRVYPIEDTKRWISTESGDVEIKWDELPIELQQALSETIGFGVERGLIVGRVHDFINNLEKRVICARTEFDLGG